MLQEACVQLKAINHYMKPQVLPLREWWILTGLLPVLYYFFLFFDVARHFPNSFAPLLHL
jgi:hypothetical protein